ncbi:PIN domain-like protein [Phascolomyces articulosus]|uniref:PIN domain-like protein n=1 Tax=Phascolomyces articulosus TaxID=60185 RepID=A0AAD5KPR1_9FUNG|nr:PIN domain-like protein [Phascolomyces articulosus]
MGIKDLWEVIEPAERQYTLEEIAADRAQRSDEHQLRIAIDVALWTFQARSSKGGRSSELRLMFYRFCRLQEQGIRAVFVFDGPGRPTWKRDREINTIPMNTEFRQALLTMIRLFDFHIWHAYGEAEAECAVLERLGYVDMVMTGDVDVFLFGARRVLRQWPAKRLMTIPCYDMAWINQTIGLDRSDMILMGLLRGSDYSHGTMQVGITIAEALARCKKHTRLMKYIQDLEEYADYVKEEAMADELRDALNYELKNGCSGHLQKVYTQTTLDHDDFPDLRILHDFIHPKTNIQNKKAEDLARWLAQPAQPDWKELTAFCNEAFQWTPSYTLRRFGSLVFPAYITWRLRNPSSVVDNESSSNTRKRAGPTSLSPNKRTKTSSSSQQLQVDSFFSVTKLNKIKTQRLFYVEFDTNVLTEFLDMLQTYMDTSAKEPRFDHLFERPHSYYLGNDDSENDDEDDDVGANVSPSEKDPKKLCRRWISADLVVSKYPRQVREFTALKAKRERAKAAKMNKKKKNTIAKDQRLLTEFITIPDSP